MLWNYPKIDQWNIFAAANSYSTRWSFISSLTCCFSPTESIQDSTTACEKVAASFPSIHRLSLFFFPPPVWAFVCLLRAKKTVQDVFPWQPSSSTWNTECQGKSMCSARGDEFSNITTSGEKLWHECKVCVFAYACVWPWARTDTITCICMPSCVFSSWGQAVPRSTLTHLH